jgi:hypothetical protein
MNIHGFFKIRVICRIRTHGGGPLDKPCVTVVDIGSPAIVGSRSHEGLYASLRCITRKDLRIMASDTGQVGRVRVIRHKL